MNDRRLIAAVIAALIVGLALGYMITRQRSGDASSQVGTSQSGDATARKDREVLYWHDPMVPGTKFDKPGKSPFMDMDLVPVYADDAGGGDVRISANATQNLGIRLGKVEKKARSQQFDAVGAVAFDDRLLEVVQARVAGYITRLYVKAPLERVRRGQPLADILAPEWLAAQQEYIGLLDAQSASNQAIREAARQRLVVLGVPDAAIRALEKDRKTTASTTVFAPIDGVVTELAVRDGAAFMAGDPLFRVNGLSTVWVNAQIPEAHISLVTMGSSVVAHATAWPETTFKGRVIALLPDVDLQTRTLTVRVAIDNPGFRLAPGMFVSLSFSAVASEPQLVVPSEAVIVTGERSVVIVSRGDGAFDVAEVRVGEDRNGMSTILSGLEEGQSIVLSGQFLIDSEASLRGTANRLTSAAPDSRAADQDSDQAGELHQAEGVVNAISEEQITIAHEAIPTLQWDAMTMPFAPPTEGWPKGIQVGTRVSFAFLATPDGGYQIKSIQPVDKQNERVQP